MYCTCAKKVSYARISQQPFQHCTLMNIISTPLELETRGWSQIQAEEKIFSDLIYFLKIDWFFVEIYWSLTKRVRNAKIWQQLFRLRTKGMVWNMAPSDLELIKVLFSYKNINLKLLWIIHSYTKIRAQVRGLADILLQHYTQKHQMMLCVTRGVGQLKRQGRPL